MTAYLKKEVMELTRTGRLLTLGIIFILLGILNPAMAKLTPWLYEMMQDSFSEQGLMIGEVIVNAMTSWTQFFKNSLMVLIVMILMSSTGFTGEYQKGTLIQVVTKGLSRKKIFLSKLVMGYTVWTMMYLVYTGVTLGYTVYFWGMDGVDNLAGGVFMYWLLGMLIMSLLSMFGAMVGNSGQVLLGTGGALFIMIVLNYIPDIKKYNPIRLADGLEIVSGKAAASEFTEAVIISLVWMGICAIIGLISFDRRKL